MNNKTYEESLPEEYQLAYHINATNTKTGIILTLLSLLLTVVPLGILVGIYFIRYSFDIEVDMYLALYLLGISLVFILYLIGHELLHGITYKALTKQKLTFGLSWSCAYCGVPNIYVYRKTAILSLIMPFAVFSILFIGIMIVSYLFNPILYCCTAIIFSFHFGGCVGDLYMLILFLFKYKDSSVLMRDTGPEQFLYTK